MDIENSSNITIQNMNVKNTLIEGIFGYKIDNLNIINTTSIDNGYKNIDASGINLDICKYAVIKNNVLSNNGFHGLVLGSSQYIDIENNICNNNGYSGFYLQYDSNNNVFINNKANNNIHGIALRTGSTKNYIKQCDFNHNKYGILENNTNGDVNTGT